MADTIDLTGGGGVLKTVIWKAKADADSRSESLPLVEGWGVTKITCMPEYAYGSAGSPPEIPPDATLVFEVELVACKPRKGSSLESVSEEKTRLEELKKQREVAAAAKEEGKRKREEAKAAVVARVQAKLEAKKGKGKQAK